MSSSWLLIPYSILQCASASSALQRPWSEVAAPIPNRQGKPNLALQRLTARRSRLAIRTSAAAAIGEVTRWRCYALSMNEAIHDTLSSETPHQWRLYALVFASLVGTHFTATWVLTLAGWSHNGAHRVSQILWEPCGRFVSMLPAGKTSVMLAMLSSSIVWAGVGLASAHPSEAPLVDGSPQLVALHTKGPTQNAAQSTGRYTRTVNRIQNLPKRGTPHFQLSAVLF